jgi:hypothetical protein
MKRSERRRETYRKYREKQGGRYGSGGGRVASKGGREMITNGSLEEVEAEKEQE